MPIDAETVHDQFETFVSLIAAMTAKQKEQPPTGPFAERFNDLLGMAKEVAPTVDARLWPKPIEIQINLSGQKMPIARYAEIQTYSQQIMNLLPTSGGMGISMA